jgi:DNA polymerase III epsilon subunit family exonuclease
MRLSEVEFVVFDTETTGLDPLCGDRVVEIAAVRMRQGVCTASFQSMVNPGRDISPGAFAVNRISPEMLIDAPLPAAVYPQFLDFCRGAALCAYNAPFDMGFLEQELRLLTLPLPEAAVFDLLRLARRLVPSLPRYALAAVAAHLGITRTQEHRAAQDVQITVEVFNRLGQIMAQQGMDDLESLQRLCVYRAQPLRNAV